MTQEEIDKLRETYPIPFEKICLYNSFAQVLGKKIDHYTKEERKVRWDKIMSLDKQMKKYWSDTSGCVGCMHLNDKEAWCNLQGFPCTVNPILTYDTGMIGMACMGTSFQKQQQELEL